ncbi:MAG: UDP-N-acetylmuramate dehydrogenase [Bacteroidales bacterium]|jgi:UDP-N-acetylmuramate dehydrogenase|nr:UDP-N-acetylmuramate dehydrogenase [Bacteroidales bacterium]
MINIRQEVPLFSYNTFGIPATASVFVESDDATELADFVRSLPDPSSAFLLGGGSNVLFVSNRCELVIHPVIKGIEVTAETGDDVWIRAGAGEGWDDFVSWCVARNYAGVENLSHIPGTVGACPIQNIGAYGTEVKETVETVETIETATGKTVTFNNQQCQFDYRDSFFKKHRGKYLITAVQFKLSKRFEPNVKYAGLKTELSRNTHVTMENMRQAVISIRSRKLPDSAELGNAGSFFKNPTINTAKSREINELDPQAPLYPVSHGYWKMSAAWLIRHAGWKGMQDGNVGTHKRQPLVIVNYGGATGKEVLDFAQKIIDSVDQKFGIRLDPEVNVV